MADFSIRSSWENLKSFEQSLFLQTIQYFLEIYFKKQELKVHKANIEALEYNYKAAVAKMQSGEETATQVALAEGKLADAQAKMGSALAELEASRSSYLKTTGVQASDNLQTPKVPDGIPKNLQDLLDVSLENNPAILSAKFDYEATKQEKQKAISGMLPKIDLFAKSTRQDSLTSNDTPSKQNLGSRDGSINQQVGVEISIPLYDGGAARSQRRSSIEKAVSKKIAIEKARQAVSDQARQSWQNFQIAKNNLEYSRKQVKAQEVALIGTQKEMEAGTKILLDVLNAQTALLEAELKLISAEKTLLLESYKILSSLGLLNAVSLNLKVEKFDLVSNYEMVKKKF
jgi:outer membrane protein